MKSFYTKFNPVAGSFVLGAAVPVAVYAIGFIAFLVWSLVSLLLFPFYYGGQFDADAFGNITAIIATALQVFAITLLTLILSVFSKMKIYHVLLAAFVSFLLFFIVERFLPKVRWSNFPETIVIFPALFKRKGINYGAISVTDFVAQRYYLITTLLLSAACMLIVLTTWVIYQISAQKKRNKNGL